MGFYFRRSTSFGPFRINFSKSGVGASFGFKGARVTLPSRGAAYITVGSNGFYYRERIGPKGDTFNRTGRYAKDSIETPVGNISTAAPADLIDSSCESVIARLNERAQMFNPSYVAYSLALLLLFAGVVSVPADTLTAPQLHLEGEAAYANLVHNYGYPDTLTITTQLDVVAIRTFRYKQAGLDVHFVQTGCVSAYNAVQKLFGDQEFYPALAKDALRRLQRCQGQETDAWVPVRFSSTTYAQLEFNESEVPMKLSRISKKRLEPPAIQGIKQTKAAVKTSLTKGVAALVPKARDQYWEVPAERLVELRQRADADARAASARRLRLRFQGAAFFVAGLLVAGFGVNLHTSDNEKRRTDFFYELPDIEKQKHSLILQAFDHLLRTDRLWWVNSKDDVQDWKRNAGASSTVRKSSARVCYEQPPRVQTNVRVPCLDLGRAKLYFLPDLVLYWESGRFGGVQYRVISVESGTTRFIKDGYVPRDAPLIDSTWKYVNKNGGPDRRFKDNRQIPIVRYGTIGIRSQTGLNIQLQSSNPEVSLAFANCWSEYNERCQSRPKKPPSRDLPPLVTEVDATPYAILGLTPGATIEEVAMAYRKKAQMYHPDKVAGLAPEFQVVAEQKMKEINSAYEQLKRRA